MLMRHRPRCLLREIIAYTMLTDSKVTATIVQIHDEQHAPRPESLDEAVDAELEVLEVVETHAYACDVEVEEVFAHQVLGDASIAAQIAEDGVEVRKACGGGTAIVFVYHAGSDVDADAGGDVGF